MSNYRKNAAANRDALFGSSSGGSSKKRNSKPKPSSSSSRPTSTTSAPSNAAAPSSYSHLREPSSSRGYSYNKPSNTQLSRPTLSGEAKALKLKEAEEHRKQAKKCMARGVFAKPDPVAASMYYKRAADAYQQCGESYLEKVHRMAGADCQMVQGTYATAAAEYIRAAEIVRDSPDMAVEEKRKEGSMLYAQAADAFLQMGEAGKSGNCRVQAAMAWTWEDDSGVLGKKALTGMEEAVESFVPDVLNRNARYRQTGVSAHADPNSDQKPDLELAKQHMVTTSYAHEPLLEMAHLLLQHREFPSALYATGAASAILESDGISTLTLGRVFVLETIIMLAMGDPVAAEQAFLNTHVQQTSYLTSRECRLAEELTRAILQRDPDILEEARSPSGPNRSAMANLHESSRALVQQLRVSGVARKKKTKPKEAALSAPVASAPSGPVDLDDTLDDDSVDANPETEAPPPATVPHPEEEDIDQLHAEMDDLLNDMGLGSDSEDELDDDDIDLR